MTNPTMRSDAFMNHAIDAHGDAVLRLALNQLRNVSDAQDAVQETFVRLLAAAATGNGTPTLHDAHPSEPSDATATGRATPPLQS